MAEVVGPIGIRRDLQARVGNTLRPQIVTLMLTDGTVLDDAGGKLVTAIYKRQIDSEPLLAPTFETRRLVGAGPPRYRIDLSKDRVTLLATIAPLEGVMVPGALARRAQQFVRRAYYSWSFEDREGMRYALYYGSITIFLGASGG